VYCISGGRKVGSVAVHYRARVPLFTHTFTRSDPETPDDDGERSIILQMSSELSKPPHMMSKSTSTVSVAEMGAKSFKLYEKGALHWADWWLRLTGASLGLDSLPKRTTC
jgi:hypothetical protein